MECIDWSCGKQSCKIWNNIINTFQYNLCRECTTKRKIESCNTCIYGDRISSTNYFCKKDNTIIISSRG